MVDALLALAGKALMTNDEGEIALHMIALSGYRGRVADTTVKKVGSIQLPISFSSPSGQRSKGNLSILLESV